MQESVALKDPGDEARDRFIDVSAALVESVSVPFQSGIVYSKRVLEIFGVG